MPRLRAWLLVLGLLLLVTCQRVERRERRPTKGQPTRQSRRKQRPLSAHGNEPAATASPPVSPNEVEEEDLRSRRVRQKQQQQHLQQHHQQHHQQQHQRQQRASASPPPRERRARVASQHHEEDGRMYRSPLKHVSIPSEAEQRAILSRVRDMFYHGYDSYMQHAYPEAELRPLSCSGGQFELVKIPLVTLIDTLDTLVLLGNHTEFRRAVHLVSTHFSSFDFDVSVSVFETTIRVLGGLLSAHLMATDPLLDIYAGQPHGYDGWLLVLAQDLGERLLPAFRTNTGIPYGTVNLRQGVPRGETEIASTAGAGSLLVEFEALSSLTGDRRFGDAAFTAAQALFDRRSPIGLLGKHIHTKTGRWFESVSGIGSNSDSFYEYLLKAYLLFRRKELFRMFTDTFAAIKRFVQVGDWFNDVDMFNGKLRRHRVENLAAFWPGMEATLGFSDAGARQLNTFYAVWSDLGFLPEEFDNVQWQAGKTTMHALYPLRPELIESTYHQYRTTGDRSWLAAGLVFLESLENSTRTDCGYASVNNLESLELLDAMPSFFLSETCKYLYLLFDEGNFVHERAYIFSTEAHLFDPMQMRRVPRQEEEEGEGSEEGDDEGFLADHRVPSEADDQEVAGVEEEALQQEVASMAALPLLPSRCGKKQWWDAVDSYDANFVRLVTPAEGEQQPPPQMRKDRTRQPSPFPSGPPTLAQARAAAAQQGPAAAPSDRSQSDVVNVLSLTAAQALYLEQRRDLSVLHASLHGHPAHAPDLSIAREEGGRTGAGAGGSSTAAGGLRRAEACYAEDEPVIDGGGDRAAPLQSVDVSMGALGEFAVQVYSDGFVVTSKTWGDTLEISNVGQSVMFVRDSNAEGVKTVIGSMDGRVVTCSVSVDAPAGSGSPPLWERACSVAAFGPVSLPSDLRATLEVPETADVDALGTLCETAAPSSAPTPRRWWVFGAPKEVPQRALVGKVAMARRGDCMFEDKAAVAGRAGAAALLVTNDKDVLFLMSGRKAEGAAVAAATGTEAEHPSTPLDAPTIPTVMLTRSDGNALLALARQARHETGAPLTITLRLTALPMVLDNSVMGADKFPKLRMRRNIIYVFGRGVWGAVLTSTSGLDWQLFIMSKTDMDPNFAPGNVLPEPISDDKARKRVRTHWGGFTSNPVEVYSHILSRQCPLYLAVDDSLTGSFGATSGEFSSTVIVKKRRL